MEVLQENINSIVKETDLRHIAIIMDGNRRWAKEKNLPSAFGHKKGVDALKKAMLACSDYGIKYLTVYAFSTENWNRNPDEVEFLMNLLGETIKNEIDEMNRNDVILSFIGDLAKLSPKLQKILFDAENLTKNNNGINLQIAFNYGGRSEIVNAVKAISAKVLDGKLTPEDITEEKVARELYTGSIPDPDLLIRTGGELRISNYLLWQIAYSEIIVVPEFWPEFDKNLLADIIIEFKNRQRRWGK